MPYVQNGKKFIAVANSKAKLPEILNAIGHAFIGLIGSSGVDEIKKMELLNYHFADGSLAAMLSTYPVIVLQSRNSGQLQRLRRDADEAGVLCFLFVRAMLGSSAEEQLASTAAQLLDGHDVIVACLWGETAVLEPLVKRFSRFRGALASDPEGPKQTEPPAV
ncbi:MAG TPA: DUF2000 family protein [Planctomycetaceae bacterium]|nr:DUF2000 family protein [Planctomycetaceae bacterium]